MGYVHECGLIAHTMDCLQEELLGGLPLAERNGGAAGEPTVPAKRPRGARWAVGACPLSSRVFEKQEHAQAPSLTRAASTPPEAFRDGNAASKLAKETPLQGGDASSATKPPRLALPLPEVGNNLKPRSLF